MDIPKGWIKQRSGVCKKGDVVGDFFGYQKADGLIGDKIINWRCLGYAVYREPLENKEVVNSTSSNNSYTAALRERVERYFSPQQKCNINSFIKSVQRLNASEKRRTAHS